MQFTYDDGGRQAAGFKGDADDCVCRAVAIATGQDYLTVYRALSKLSAIERTSKRLRGRSHPRTGIHRTTTRRYLESLGWRYVPTMAVGQGCKVHLRTGELPTGRLIVQVSKHVTAVIDGMIHDTGDCSRGGTRCVYGYYVAP